MLKPQDIYVLLKLVAIGSRPWSYAILAVELGMSPSQVHSTIKRALAAMLVVRQREKIVPHFRNLEEFLIHGLKYVFWAEHGEMTRGMLTAYAAPPLAELLVSTTTEPPPVWPDPDGEVRGLCFQPLHKKAPQAARADKNFYELLALVDAVRSGRAREKEIATKKLRMRLEQYVSDSKPQP
jgi:predicted transcriptional regulator